ncbi:M15 family metallopeptidase [Microbacterium sp. JZ37]|uniref:M15 family metallopeptidase n=1 Tax=Microbacterium sp. JZ37 TaxID=2654193 RepID=UPI002B495FEA|nr:M15 family metallopeptidase [Microbacterium sp. JZ37]WRH18577.1 D-alanyl-D-alanine carboxypeptidase family protein [Microbacterium sp. JZ37]
MTNGRYARRRGLVARHAARPPRLLSGRGLVVLATAAGVVAACVLGAVWSVAHDERPAHASSAQTASPAPVETPPGSIESLPVPQFEVVVAEDPCASPAAAAAGDAAAVVAAFGGAEEFREAAAEGASCIRLDDPTQPWVVVNKQRPVNPIDYAPEVMVPAGTRSLVGGGLRPDAAAALDALVADAAASGAGDVALQSGYRSYQTQVSTFQGQIGALGEEGAEAISARPGFSEHQLGLAADVVACTSGSCGTIYDIAGTPQGDWIVENAWRHGWIVRYESGHTDTTGYNPEPWHLRYIGVELAQAYHEGGYHTLEEFFGLPAAPDYAD